MKVFTKTESFSPVNGDGMAEYHSIIRVSQPGEPYLTQLAAIVSALSELPGTLHFVRLFLSDAANQFESARTEMARFNVPVSYIQQPSLDGTKIAAWAYSTEGPCPLIWHSCFTSAEGNSETQMKSIFDAYEATLATDGLSVADNCLRTWIYVHDVDVNYGGVVKGRRDYFNRIGLTTDTHYIASTGIEGRHADPKKLVVMDAVALKDMKSVQLQYLYAKDHLNRTSEYGVTFERGTAVHFSDRTHIYISGTASIDDKGQVLYEGDIRKQTKRMLENISALLAEASAAIPDIKMATVYLRDMSDYTTVMDIISSECPGLNVVYTLAPVCRRTWLVEMECIAVIQKLR